MVTQISGFEYLFISHQSYEKKLLLPLFFFLFLLLKIKDGDSNFGVRILIYFTPKLRKETIITFIFLSISTPENKRW